MTSLTSGQFKAVPPPGGTPGGMLDNSSLIGYDSSMENNICCDGTGWTGVEGVICAEHYNSCLDLFEFSHFDEEE